MLMALISKITFMYKSIKVCNDVNEDIRNINCLRIPFNVLLKKGTPYVSAIKVIFDMSAINIHCLLQIFHSI